MRRHVLVPGSGSRVEDGLYAVTVHAAHRVLKVAHWGSWGFWGLEKSSKVMRKSRDDDSFFCFRVSKGIERVTLEKKSRNLIAISALSRTISARSGDR